MLRWLIGRRRPHTLQPRHGLAALILDTLTGNRDNVVGYKTSARFTLWMVTGGAAASWRTFRNVTWRWRRTLTPVYGAAACWVIAFWEHLDHVWEAPAWIGAAFVPWVWWRLGGWAGPLTRPRSRPRAVRAQLAAAYALAWAWTTWASATNPYPPRLGVWVLALGACWVMWWRRNRIRPAAVPQIGEIVATWEKVRGAEGTTLVNITEQADPRRVVFDIDLDDCDLVASELQEKLGMQVAKKFRVPWPNIMIGYGPGNLEHLARADIVFDNPLDDPLIFDDTWIPTPAEVAAGIVRVGRYPNGDPVTARLWWPGRELGVPGAGGVFTLFSGDPGAGKSAGMGALLTLATFTGRVWPMAGCPQNGASYPEWAGADGQAAWKSACAPDDDGGVDPIMQQLEYLSALGDDRTRRLAKFRWCDKEGDWHTGMNCWDYDIIAEFAEVNGTKPWPLVVFALDEMWRLLREPRYAPIIKAAVKLWRKAGIDMLGATQYPALQEFGNDEALRQPLASGNVFACRNSATATGAMILDRGMPSPNSIPQQTADGSDTKGMCTAQLQGPNSARPVYSRLVWAQRAAHYAARAAQRIHELEPEAVELLREWLPEGQNWTAPRPDDIEDADADMAVAPAGGTVLERALAHLATCRDTGFQATTGAIAAAIDARSSSTSSALTRAMTRGEPRLVPPVGGSGIWGLAPAYQPAPAREEVPA